MKLVLLVYMSKQPNIYRQVHLWNFSEPIPQLFRVLGIYNFGCRSHTGRGDLSSLGQIQSFNGEKNYNKWSDPKCDKIKGGDGSFMSPNLDLNSR